MLDYQVALMQTCRRCGKELPATAFYKDPRRDGGLRSVCKSCWAERKKEYRATHKEEISESGKRYYRANKDKINQRIQKWRKDNHQKLMEQQRIRRDMGRETLSQLKKPCVKCGEARPWVIHFHHIDPTVKAFEIDQEAVIYRKEDCLKEEIEKCACLCANCHTEFHYLFGKKPSDPVKDFNNYLWGDVNETDT